MVNINKKEISLYFCCNLVSVLILFISSTDGQADSIRTCPRPLPPENAIIVNWDAPRKCDGTGNCNNNYGVDPYQEYDKVYFACRENFQLASQNKYEMSVTCGSDGNWFPKIEELEKCVNISHFRNCEAPDVFRCKTSGQCIPKHKECNCDVDCADGSDERNCKERVKIINALPGQRRYISSPGYPRAEDYPKNPFRCVYKILTLPPSHIRIEFEEFDLPRKTNKVCADYVRLVSAHPRFLLAANTKKRRKRRKAQPKKCGPNGFDGVIYSNDAGLEIDVALGYGHKNPYRHYRGILFSWEVRSKEDFLSALRVANKKMNTEYVVAVPSQTKAIKGANSEKLYTFILPMVIVCGALVFISLTFCVVRQFKRKDSKDTNNFLPTTSEPSTTAFGESRSSHKSTTSFTLTENNLAKFDEVQNQHAKRLNSSSSSSRRPPANGTKSSAADKCGSSQNSDLPRYIMSYDIPLKQPSNGQSSFSSHQQHRRSTSPPTGASCAKNSSSTLNSGTKHLHQHCESGVVNNNNNNKDMRKSCQDSSTSSQEYSTTSSENTSSFSSRQQGTGRLHSSGASQSTNTCSLCHQQRKSCHGDRFKHFHQQQKHHQDDMFEQKQQHFKSQSGEIPYTSRNIYEQSRLHYMETVYPTEHPAHGPEVERVSGDRFSLEDSYNYNNENYYPSTTCDEPLYGQEYPQQQQYPPSFYETSLYEGRCFIPENVREGFNNKDNCIDNSTLSGSLHHRTVEKRKVIYMEEIYDTERREDEGGFMRMMNSYGDPPTYADRALGGSLICTH